MGQSGRAITHRGQHRATVHQPVIAMREEAQEGQSWFFKRGRKARFLLCIKISNVQSWQMNTENQTKQALGFLRFGEHLVWTERVLGPGQQLRSSRSEVESPSG